VENEAGNHEAAIRLHRRGLALAEQKLGAEHPVIGAIENNLGTAMMRAGDVAGAKVHYQRSVEVWSKALGPDHPNLAYALSGLGDVALAEHDPKAAIEPFTRALQLREHGNAAAGDIADARIGLARARFELGLDPLAVARKEVLRARDEYASVDSREGVALADAWLTEHPG
jgi:eukaryotic-like serine/threonine-protein kinase